MRLAQIWAREASDGTPAGSEIASRGPNPVLRDGIDVSSRPWLTEMARFVRFPLAGPQLKTGWRSVSAGKEG